MWKACLYIVPSLFVLFASSIHLQMNNVQEFFAFFHFLHKHTGASHNKGIS